VIECSAIVTPNHALQRTQTRTLEVPIVGAGALRDTPMPFEHYKDIVEFGKWAEIERRYGR
jgi:hypothetical protein